MIYPTRYPKCPVKNDPAQPDHTADISKKVDLIDRQAAIDAISCDIIVTGRQNAELVAATIGTFADRIKALPSAQPEQQWIPCSERLPEEGGYYLTTTMYQEVYCDYWNGDNYDRTEMVIAWMPLPEPWKGEQK